MTLEPNFRTILWHQSNIYVKLGRHKIFLHTICCTKYKVISNLRPYNMCSMKIQENWKNMSWRSLYFMTFMTFCQILWHFMTFLVFGLNFRTYYDFMTPGSPVSVIVYNCWLNSRLFWQNYAYIRQNGCYGW